VEAVSAALAARTGAGLSEPGRAAGSVVWAGMGPWLVEGSDPAAVAALLRGLAAVTDQSDGWAGMVLSGPAARAVLARLVPLDLDPAAFPEGAAARSMLRHVPLLLIAAEARFRLIVPRSYARTAVEDLAGAMAGVAARGGLG
jgi:sarcosine oxidase subunit gamma